MEMVEHWRRCRQERKLPTSEEFTEQLLKHLSIVRIVTVMDVASFSTLELLELGVTKTDIQYAYANGVIELDPVAVSRTPSPEVVEIMANEHYDCWNNRKFRLTEELGLFILEALSVGGNQLGSKACECPGQ